MTELFAATTGLVAVAWIGSVAGIDEGQVGTTLPKPEHWNEDGFITVLTVGGTPHVNFALRKPVVQIDCWANNLNSNKPPWGKSNNLAEIILKGMYVDQLDIQRTLTLRDGFHNAKVLSIYPQSEPRRIRDDNASYARYQFDAIMDWIES
jgi:hypothetical protein